MVFSKEYKLSEKNADRKMELSQFDLNICILRNTDRIYRKMSIVTVGEG